MEKGCIASGDGRPPGSLAIEHGGRIPFRADPLYEKGLLSEAEIECEAQIDKVLGSKLEIDHLDSHMGVLQIHPEYILRFFDIAARHRLPIRMGSPRLAAYFGLPESILEVARAHGLVFPDNLVYIPMSLTGRKQMRFEAYDFAVKNIPRGVTEIYFHPALPGSDYLDLQHQYSERKDLSYESIRIWDYEYLESGRLNKIIREEGIVVLGYSALKELMRSGDE